MFLKTRTPQFCKAFKEISFFREKIVRIEPTKSIIYYFASTIQQ